MQNQNVNLPARALRIALPVFAVALWGAMPLFAQNQTPETSEDSTLIDTGLEIPIPIKIQGEIEYQPEEQLVIVRSTEEKRALVLRGEQTISAQEIVYDQGEQTFAAHGGVRLWDRGQIYTGDELIYDLKTEKGTLYNPGSVGTAQQFFVDGNKLEIDEVETAPRWKGRWWRHPPRADKLRRYKISDGTATTCDLPVPHYHVKFSELEVIPGDRFWIEDFAMQAGGWPMGYLPYFTRSLAEHRVSYIFSAGSFSDLGFGALNKINVHLDPRLRLAFFADYLSDAGFGTGGSYRFNFPEPYGPKGWVRGYWIDQQEADDDKLFEDEERWRTAGEYTQDLPWGWRFIAQFQQRSDFEYSDDYDRLERVRGVTNYEIERDTPSFASLSKSWDEQTVRITAAKRLEDFFQTSLPGVERLPQARWDLMPTQIADLGLYADAHMDYGDLRREQGFNKRTNFVDQTERLDGELKLLYPVRLPWAVNMTPFAGYRGTGYFNPTRRDNVDGIPGKEEGNFDDLTRNIGEAGVTFNTRFAHIWENDSSSQPGAFDAMRLVVQPEVGYGYYAPDESLEEEFDNGVRFPFIDSVDDYRAEMHRITGRVSTSLQGKKGIQTRTLARYGIGIGYDQFPDDNLIYEDFDFDDDLAENPDSRTTDLRQDLTIRPIDWLTFGHFLRYDVDDSLVRSSNTYFSFSYWENWNSTLGFNSYDDPFIDIEEQEEAYLRFLLRLSHKWSIMYHTRYDIDGSDSRRHRVTFARDLHDFIALLELEQKNRENRDEEFSVIFHLQFKGFGQYLPMY